MNPKTNLAVRTSQNSRRAGMVTVLLTVQLAIFVGALIAQSQGDYFSKKQHAPQPLPKFEELRDRLPAPIYDKKPE